MKTECATLKEGAGVERTQECHPDNWGAIVARQLRQEKVASKTLKVILQKPTCSVDLRWREELLAMPIMFTRLCRQAGA